MGDASGTDSSSGGPRHQLRLARAEYPGGNGAPIEKSHWRPNAWPAMNSRWKRTRRTIAQFHEVDYRVQGEGMQFVEIGLDPGDAVIAEAGGLMYTDGVIVMETIFGDGNRQSQSGEFLNALHGARKRLLIGGSPFMTVFGNSSGGKQRVAFGAGGLGWPKLPAKFEETPYASARVSSQIPATWRGHAAVNFPAPSPPSRPPTRAPGRARQRKFPSRRASPGPSCRPRRRFRLRSTSRTPQVCALGVRLSR